MFHHMKKYSRYCKHNNNKSAKENINKDIKMYLKHNN